MLFFSSSNLELIETRKTALEGELARNRSKMNMFNCANQDVKPFLVQIESSPVRSGRSRSRSASEESFVLPSDDKVKSEMIVDDPLESVVEVDPVIETSDTK